MEQFEVIRRAHFVHEKSIRAISREQGVHRRVVRQALNNAVPPKRRPPSRAPRVLTLEMRHQVDQWLQTDRSAPKKQRHTARRMYQRLVDEHGYTGAESTIRAYVGRRRRELGLKSQVYIPREQVAGVEAEVDWYEAQVEFPSGRCKVQIFQMRACFSGREFHWAYPAQTQQAFLDGHCRAFEHFGGTFARIRYDNLSSAVTRVLRGRRRVETARFVALRSHYLFDAEFCQVGLRGASEKGGVENGVGRFRRNHLVPVPCFEDFSALNDYLSACCQKDDTRRMAGREHAIIEDWAQEQPALRTLPPEPFEVDEMSVHRVDAKSRVRVRTNHYSVPVRWVGREVEVRLGAQAVRIYGQGQLLAQHPRSYGRHDAHLVLDHYLELLYQKPGALARSVPLAQARREGRWCERYDRLWAALQARLGDIQGTRALLDVLWLHRDYDTAWVAQCVDQALQLGCADAGSIAVLARQASSDAPLPVLDALGPLARYGAASAGALSHYDALRSNLAEGVR